MPQRVSKQNKTEFILYEYELLQNFRNVIIEQVDKRVNFYITIAVSLFASISFIKEFSGIETEIILLALVILIYFGYVTFERVIQGHLSIIYYTRGINRIRNYFIGNDSELSKFFLLPTTDSKPAFGTFGFSSVKIKRLGVLSLIIFLNTLFFVVLIYFLTQHFSFSNKLSFILTIIAFLVSIIFHWLMHKSRISASKSSFNIEFPTVDE